MLIYACESSKGSLGTQACPSESSASICDTSYPEEQESGCNQQMLLRQEPWKDKGDTKGRVKDEGSDTESQG